LLFAEDSKSPAASESDQPQPPKLRHKSSSTVREYLNRTPSPHPELAPAVVRGHSQTWSRTSSRSALNQLPPRPPAAIRKVSTGATETSEEGASELYFTPAVSLANFRNSPLPQLSLPKYSSEGLGVTEDTAGVLSGLLSHSITGPDENRGQYRIQRRYTEDWVLRGFQQHRRASPSWYSDDHYDSAVEEDDVESPSERGHSRNISNANTITQTNYQGSPPLGILEVEVSDQTSEVTGTTEEVFGLFVTAPQSLVDYPIDIMEMPRLPPLSSRWADLTPSPVASPADDKVNGFKLEVPPPPPPAPVEATPETTPTDQKTSSSVGQYLLSAPKSLPASRTSTPGTKKIKFQGKNVIIRIPADSNFGEPNGRPFPLTVEQVQTKMREWVEQGYDIEIGGQGAVREIFPAEQTEKVDPSEIYVSVPDKSGMFVLVSARGAGVKSHARINLIHY
jgi:hypothetical protein